MTDLAKRMFEIVNPSKAWHDLPFSDQSLWIEAARLAYDDGYETGYHSGSYDAGEDGELLSDDD